MMLEAVLLFMTAGNSDLRRPEIERAVRRPIEARERIKTYHIKFQVRSEHLHPTAPRRHGNNEIHEHWFDGQKLRVDVSELGPTDQPNQPTKNRMMYCRDCTKNGFTDYYRDLQKLRTATNAEYNKNIAMIFHAYDPRIIGHTFGSVINWHEEGLHGRLLDPVYDYEAIVPYERGYALKGTIKT
jgi:hypothetical protein